MTAVPVVEVPAAARETASVWWARIPRRTLPPVEHSLLAVNSERFPHGTPVDLSALAAAGRRPTGWLVDVRYRAADGSVVRLDVAAEVADPGVRVWFAEVHHASGAIPAVTLSVFVGEAFPAGTLVGPHQVAAAGLRVRDRVAEVRWFTRCGLVDTVLVAPAWRGRGLGRLVTVAAEGLTQLRGLPGLTGGEELTDSAVAWLDASPACWHPRLARRTRRLPEAGRGPSGVQRLLADAVPRLI